MGTTTRHYATIWSICVLRKVRWHKLGEVDNECTSHNLMVLAICVPKIIKFDEHLTKFWQKQVVTFWPTLYKFLEL